MRGIFRGLVGAALIACSGGDAASGGGVANEQALPDGSAGVDAGPGSGAEAGFGDGAAGCSNRCSADLKSVIDCRSDVATPCSDAQLCSPGSVTCVAACDAAKGFQSHVGCEFFAYPPDGYLGSTLGWIRQEKGHCYALMLVNASTADAEIALERKGQRLDISNALFSADSARTKLMSGAIPRGGAAYLFVGGSCPSSASVGDPAIHGVGMSDAFRLSSTQPIAAYDFQRYNVPAADHLSDPTSSTLLLPTHMWGTNYVGLGEFQVSTGSDTQYQAGLALVASEDGTDVTVLPPNGLRGENHVTGALPNTSRTYSLNKGEFIQFSQTNSMIGMPIASNKPIATFGGGNANGTLHQQFAPVKALGYEYVAVRHADRLPGSSEPDVAQWQVVATVDGTQFSYFPNKPSAESPVSLNKGESAQFITDDPFVIKSQDPDHPFYLVHYVPSQAGNGSPFVGGRQFVNAIPIAQFLNAYAFMIPDVLPDAHLVVARVKRDGQFHDVTLGCLGRLTGWKPEPASGDFQWVRVPIVENNAKQGNCGFGRHEMSSEAPFGVTVWGWGRAVYNRTTTLYEGTGRVAYAYPAGLGLRNVNNAKVEPVPR